MKSRFILSIKSPPERHWVGNGFFVHGFLHPADLSLSPFALLDYNPPMTVEHSSLQRGVGSHPHRGFETVTIVYNGAIAHKDSSGGGGVIAQGEVQWMTAGSGVIHSEFYEDEFNNTGGEVEFAQIWINLPAKHKMTKPKYQHLKDFEIIKQDGATIEVIAGEFEDVRGKATTFSEINMWNIRLEKGSQFVTKIPSHHNAAILVRRGLCIIGEQTIRSVELTHFMPGDEAIEIVASENCELLFLSGEPIDEPLVSYGPFLMNTKEQVIEAIEDFNSGKFGSLPFSK
jgi:quercetin 2,3-dioxygenase